MFDFYLQNSLDFYSFYFWEEVQEGHQEGESLFSHVFHVQHQVKL